MYNRLLCGRIGKNIELFFSKGYKERSEIMENEKKFILDGYRFEKEADYRRAEREMNRISEIKKTNDLRDEAGLRKVYDMLVEGETFTTPIGLGFLREAQRKLIQNPAQKRTMKAIPVKMTQTVNQEEGLKSTFDFRLLYEALKLRYRNLKIVLAFLIFIIIVLFSVTIFDRSLTPEKAREAVLNEYASWKEELTSKEQELRDREKIIKEKEEALLPKKEDN